MPIEKSLAEILDSGAPGVTTMFDRLAGRLVQRQKPVRRFLDYYEGKHPLVYASAKYRTEFGNLFADFRDNFCDLVVDAVGERLSVEGFRFDITEPTADKDAWEIWQRSSLDAWAPMAHTEALTTGVSYATVWADKNDQPTVTVESAEQMVVATSQATGMRVGALKMWRDDDGYGYATLYLPDFLWKFRTTKLLDTIGNQDLESAEWEARPMGDEPWPLTNPLGEVPVVPIVNRPYLTPRKDNGGMEGRSEIQNAIPVQNMINTMCLQTFVSGEFSSFRQRWATGMDIPTDPETNQPVEPFKAAVDRLWISEDPETKFGEFQPTDLSNYVQVIEMYVQHLATQTRTPPHYFFLNGNYPSGDAITSAETGLVAKAMNRSLFLGEAWEEVMRLCFAVLDDPRADVTTAETMWGEMQHRTAAEQADAALKRKSLGVPLRQLWSDVGYTETQMDQFDSMRVGEALIQMMSTPAPTFGVPDPAAPPAQ